jgi:hypothetical protein
MEGYENVWNIKRKNTKKYHKIGQNTSTWTSLKTVGKLRCSGWVSSSCSTRDTRRVTVERQEHHLLSSPLNITWKFTTSDYPFGIFQFFFFFLTPISQILFSIHLVTFLLQSLQIFLNSMLFWLNGFFHFIIFKILDLQNETEWNKRK